MNTSTNVSITTNASAESHGVSCDAYGEDRGYEAHFNYGDFICTMTACIIFVFMVIPTYYLLVKTNPFEAAGSRGEVQETTPSPVKSTSSIRSAVSVTYKFPTGQGRKSANLSKKKDNLSWYLGVASGTLYFIRELIDIVFWIEWTITYEYCEGSLTWFADSGVHVFNVLSTVSLYLYFIYRLYSLYQQSSGMYFSQKQRKLL